jgi:hypothetical protein
MITARLHSPIRIIRAEIVYDVVQVWFGSRAVSVRATIELLIPALGSPCVSADTNRPFDDTMNNAGWFAGGYNHLMAKRLDYTKKPRTRQVIQIGDDDDAQISTWQINKQQRASIQRDNPRLGPAAVERLLQQRLARAYRPYRPPTYLKTSTPQ